MYRHILPGRVLVPEPAREPGPGQALDLARGLELEPAKVPETVPGLASGLFLRIRQVSAMQSLLWPEERINTFSLLILHI
jgi:hypothetical protein